MKYKITIYTMLGADVLEYPNKLILYITTDFKRHIRYDRQMNDEILQKWLQIRLFLHVIKNI